MTGPFKDAEVKKMDLNQLKNEIDQWKLMFMEKTTATIEAAYKKQYEE